MKWLTIFIVFILNFSLMVGFGWKTCSQMFVRVWNHIIGAHKKPEALFFFFSPLLSSSGSVCKALKKPELPFEKWCFIFISETSFGLDLHLKVEGFLLLHY